MGLYIRKDSPYWWMLLERAGQKPLYEGTRVIHHAHTAEGRKQQKQLAQDIYIDRMNHLARRAHNLPPKKTVTFKAHVAWYTEHVLPTHRGHQRERDTFPLLLRWFGEDDLLRVTPDRVREYCTWRLAAKLRRGKGTVTPNTINREVDVLKGVMAAAVPRWFAVSPLKGVPRLRVVKRKKRLLTPDEEVRLLAQLQPIDRVFYLTALDSLMRLSNVINLRKDEDKGTHFELRDSKTGPYRVVVSNRVRALLDRLKKKTRGPYYFSHRRKAKKPRDWRSAVRLMLRRACARCKPPIPYGRAVGGITFHSGTRATGATRMLRAGHDLKTVQEIGNWQDVRSMAGYLESDDTLKRNAVESITPALRSADGPAKRPMKSRRKAS